MYNTPGYDSGEGGALAQAYPAMAQQVAPTIGTAPSMTAAPGANLPPELLALLRSGQYTPSTDLYGKAFAAPTYYDAASDMYYQPSYAQNGGTESSDPSQGALTGYLGFYNSPDAVGKANLQYDANGNYTNPFATATTDQFTSDDLMGVITALAAGFGGSALLGGAGAAGAGLAGTGTLDALPLMEGLGTGVLPEFGAAGLGTMEALPLMEGLEGGVLPEFGQGALGTFNAAADSQLANTQLGQDAYSGGATGVTQSPIDYSSPYTNTNSTFNAAQDSQLANTGIQSGTGGFEGWTGANGTDALSGYTQAGTGGVTQSPITTAPAPAPVSNGGGSTLTDLGNIGRIATTVGTLLNTGGGAAPAPGPAPAPAPVYFDDGNWLPPGWGGQHPLYRPGVDAVPEGWNAAGSAHFADGGRVPWHVANCACKACGGRV